MPQLTSKQTNSSLSNSTLSAQQAVQQQFEPPPQNPNPQLRVKKDVSLKMGKKKNFRFFFQKFTILKRDLLLIFISNQIRVSC
jgi:hypothetical protein